MDGRVAGWRLWQEKIAAYPRLGVAIETSFGAAVEHCSKASSSFILVHPLNAKRYRERQCSSGNKT